jgi:PIN domain nuclease of toxin-antitoxin system
MNLLLDTHVLLWATLLPARLATTTQQRLTEPTNRLWFSAVSLWEVSIKAGRGRPDFDVDPRRFRRELLDHGYRELSVDGEHATAVADLPPHHRDPFDRMLVAQARVEGMTLLTVDPEVLAYGAPTERA